MPSTEMLPAAEAELARSIISKLNWRVLPFVLVLYIIAMIDRTNVSFAALQMNEDLGLVRHGDDVCQWADELLHAALPAGRCPVGFLRPAPLRPGWR